MSSRSARASRMRSSTTMAARRRNARSTIRCSSSKRSRAGCTTSATNLRASLAEEIHHSAYEPAAAGHLRRDVGQPDRSLGADRDLERAVDLVLSVELADDAALDLGRRDLGDDDVAVD